ncbi:MAG: hypothetical protein LBP87_03710 [Planctomycetaceae bacterium]|nr:hypothetical protein [Planctomycetaceae bacterium]
MSLSLKGRRRFAETPQRLIGNYNRGKVGEYADATFQEKRCLPFEFVIIW